MQVLYRKQKKRKQNRYNISSLINDVCLDKSLKIILIRQPDLIVYCLRISAKNVRIRLLENWSDSLAGYAI